MHIDCTISEIESIETRVDPLLQKPSQQWKLKLKSVATTQWSIKSVQQNKNIDNNNRWRFPSNYCSLYQKSN